MFADYWEVQNLGVDELVSVTTVWNNLAANMLNKQSGTEVMGWSHRYGLGEVLTAADCERLLRYITQLYCST